MFAYIKRNLPNFIKSPLIKLKLKTINHIGKKLAARKMEKKHGQWLEELKSKEKIKVVFLAIHKSVWKVDTVFQRMLVDSYFEPEILVCPYIQYGEERMLEDLNAAYDYFKEKGYPVKKSFNKENGTWVTLDDINPDLVFFTNPHNLTKREYYDKAYRNYLSCYVPYYFMATNHVGDDSLQFNTTMKLSMWKIYWPHDVVHSTYSKHAANSGVNGLVVGYPATEKFIGQEMEEDNLVWKQQNIKKKKIIFSPHHTIDDDKNSLSQFLNVAEFIVKLAQNNKESVQWSFKPHPILKPKLYLHSDWGKAKTDNYYSFWESQTFTQLDDGEYDDLFIQSDAIIHDCSSFIVEYAFTRNPSLYLVNSNNLKELVNEFGRGVLQTYELAKNNTQIEKFVKRVITGKIVQSDSKRQFFENYVKRYYGSIKPSERIIEDIKTALVNTSAEK